MRARLLIVTGWVALLGAVPIYAQRPDAAQHWSETVWTPIIEQDGVAFSYIFYPEADNTNNGVVVRLINTNDYPIRYAFIIIFRTWDGQEKMEQVQGRLEAGRMKTGDSAGLFWIPFRDDRSVGEVGLRGIHIERVRTGGPE